MQGAAARARDNFSCFKPNRTVIKAKAQHTLKELGGFGSFGHDIPPGHSGRHPCLTFGPHTCSRCRSCLPGPDSNSDRFFGVFPFSPFRIELFYRRRSSQPAFLFFFPTAAQRVGSMPFSPGPRVQADVWSLGRKLQRRRLPLSATSFSPRGSGFLYCRSPISLPTLPLASTGSRGCLNAVEPTHKGCLAFCGAVVQLLWLLPGDEEK